MAETMPVVLLDEQRKIMFGRRPVPVPCPDQVLVEVDLCGICGSDLHAPDLPQVYRGGFVLGHEPSGTIKWGGAEGDGWEAGQGVAVNPKGNGSRSGADWPARRPNFRHHATMETAIGL